MTKRYEKSTIEDKRNFVTFALDNMKLCIFHLKGKEGSKAERAQSKAPRNLGPADTVVYESFGCATLQLCGDSHWTSTWINGDFRVEGKYQKKIGAIKRLAHRWWEQNLARPIFLIESYVNHIFREHSKEADHWANVGAIGEKEIVVDKGSNTEK